MFTEIYEWLTTSCPRDARKLGYLQEAVAIQARYKRHQTRWQPHLDASKAVIRAAMEGPGNKRVAVILGSGALYDVPLDALARTFERVELIDIIHPKKRAKLPQPIRPSPSGVRLTWTRPRPGQLCRVGRRTRDISSPCRYSSRKPTWSFPSIWSPN